MKLRKHENRTTYGISYAQEEFSPGATWTELIERATLDIPLAHPDDLHHVHIVNAYLGIVCLTSAQQAGEADYVDHAYLNFEDRTVDFDTTHRFAFDAVIPSCTSLSLDVAHE